MRFCYQHKVSIKPLWIPDEDTNECYCCLGIFTFSTRRHHCRTCGNVVCDSCSKHKEMIQGNSIRICRACNTYLWIKRSGEDIDHIIHSMNQCITNYPQKWSNLKILLRAQYQIIKQIQINHKNNNFNDNHVFVSILDYKKNNDIDLSHIGLNTIESLLECERSTDMIYFICIPPKHNPKLSPWTRRILFITCDAKIFMSSPLDNTFSLKQFVSDHHQQPIETYINFQYYAPLNRLFQQQIVPIQQHFLHIPQFQHVHSKQHTLIIYMTKRNAKINGMAANNVYSSVIVREKQKAKKSHTNGIKTSQFRNWSYFKDKHMALDCKQDITDQADLTDTDHDHNHHVLDANVLIDVNKSTPTLVILPFCVGLYPFYVSKSGKNSTLKLPLNPPPRPPLTPRKKSLGDVLPEPRKPIRKKSPKNTSPTPPLPPPRLSNGKSNDIQNSNDVNDMDNAEDEFELIAKYNNGTDECKDNNIKEEGWMNKLFKRKNTDKTTQSVYTEYMSRFSSFFGDPMEQNSTAHSPKSRSISRDMEESDITFNPQQNMFPETDWKYLDYERVDGDGDGFVFESAQDLYETLNCHRHEYLRRYYANIVLFHCTISLMAKSVSWQCQPHVCKLEVLWNNFVIHTAAYTAKPVPFSEMILLKNGCHKYWKEIGFQGADPLTDFRGMGEFALNCLVYFAQHYAPHCQVIFSKQRAENNYYPLCASFINIVNLICELTNARKVEELDISQQTALFKLFVTASDSHAFEELFCLICRVFDNVWRATKSFYWDFPKLYNAFHDRITFLLSKEPKSLQILMQWLEVDTYIFEYKEADFNEMDTCDSNLLLLNAK